MKRILNSLLLIICTCNIVTAQNSPVVPTETKIALEDAANMINTYSLNRTLTAAGTPPLIFQGSYIIDINAQSMFYNYLFNGDFEFLHIYLMYDGTANPTYKNFSLGITGVTIDNTGQIPGSLKTFCRTNSDYSGPPSNVPGLFQATVCPCSMYDPNFDLQTAPTGPSGTPCNFSGPKSDMFLPGGSASAPNAATFINNFQLYNIANYEVQNLYPQSILIRADKLINNFIKNPDNAQDGYQLQFLQIYVALNANAIEKDIQHEFKLIIVGLDGNGNHVYYYENGVDYAFEDILPCPYCGTILDPILDGSAIQLPARAFLNTFKTNFSEYKAWLNIK